MNKEEKRVLIIILWTSIAVIVGLFFLARRLWFRSQGGNNVVVRPSPVATPAASKSEGFVLVTLNELLLTGPSLELEAVNVIAFTKLAAEAAKRSEGLVVLVTVPDAASVTEKMIEEKLDTAGLIQAGLKPHRIVLTSTIEGRISVGRQMQAQVFIDPDARVVAELEGKVPRVVHVGAAEVKKFIASKFPSP